MKKIKLLPLPVIALILELLPFGAVLIFSPSATDRVRETYSYFSLTPFGYANFGPFVAAVLTCVLIAFALFSLKQRRFTGAVCIVSAVAMVASLLPLFHGREYCTAVGGIITLLLVAESILAAEEAFIRQPDKE